MTVMPAQTRDVAVIVCAHTMERWNALCAAIASVEQQSMTPREVVIVIDHNDDLEAKARDTFPSALVVTNRGPRGLSSARNTGISASISPMIAFLDDDAIADRFWLSRLVEHCRIPNVLGATSCIEPNWMGPRPFWLPDEFLWIVGCSYRGLPAKSAEVRNVMGCAMLITRRVFEQAGWFSHGLGRTQSGPALLSCEETELCIRARDCFPTGRFVYEPRSVVHHQVHSARLTWCYFRQRCFAEGLSKARLTTLAGSRRVLTSERSYVLGTLTTGCVKEFVGGFGRRSGIGRPFAMLAGLSFVIAGYIHGKLRRDPAAGDSHDVSMPVNATAVAFVRQERS